MRISRKAAVTSLGVAAVSVLAVGASAASAPGPGAHSHLGFWAVTTPGESFTKIAERAAQGNRAARVIATIEAMLREQRQHPIYIPEGTRLVRATRAELKAALAAVSRQAGK